MSTFLTGSELENKLTDIIWNAKKYVIIISPFIKLDDHTKKIFDKIKSKHSVSLFILFGKNEEYKHKSFNLEDLEYFKEFKNVCILYNKDLHAKHYCNEGEGLITSLNLYGFSMVNNIEFGVYFTKTVLNPLDKLFEETEKHTDAIIFEKSEVIYLKKPQYSKKLFGLTKEYQQSVILFDETKSFFKGNNYESKHYGEFNLESETFIEKKFDAKPQRDEVNNKQIEKEIKKNPFEFKKKEQKLGYCIRTGVEIPFNPQQPLCLEAWKEWNEYKNDNYPETYCHKTGKLSFGKTSMANPILKII